MRAETFQKILDLLWDGPHGVQWDKAADDLGPNVRTLQRWASGKNEISPWFPAHLRARIGEIFAEANALLDADRDEPGEADPEE